MSQKLDDAGDAENSAWLWDWAPINSTLPENSIDIEVGILECWTYDGSGHVTESVKNFETRHLHTESMESWLKAPIPTRLGQQPSSGCKMVVMPCGNLGPLPHLTADEAHSFNTALGLPGFHMHFGSLNAGACGMFLQSDGSYVFILRRNTDLASIGTALRYDPRTNVTLGVFFIDVNNINIDDFKKIPEQFAKCGHPLLLPLLAAELTAVYKVNHITSYSQVLVELENTTGYGLKGWQGDSESSSDYRALVRRLGEAQSQVYLAQATITAARFSVHFLRQKLQHLNRVVPEDCQKKLSPLCQMMEERIEYLLSSIDHACVWGGLKERMESQQTVLFNLIAQSDSLINVSLAKDSREMAVASKQDSSAMKIIALLTTFFLPGTFIASFFAMPLFNWSEPSLNLVANRHFWVYWAVTGPLTLAIMAGVISWAIWNNRQVELLQSRARESVVNDSKGGKVKDNDEKGSWEREEKTEGISTSERELREKNSLLSMLNRRRQSGFAIAEP